MENVNHPYHYQSDSGIEVIDVIDAYTKTLPSNEGFYIGTILKYCCRYNKKNGIEDLKKAKWYLDRMIENMESSQKK